MLNSFKEYEWCFFTMMGKYFSRKEIAKEMGQQLYSNENMIWFILYEDIKDIKGFISIENKINYYYIDNFYVIPNERKKGYGEKLIKKVMEIYKKNIIKVETKNEIARKIFEKYNFQIYGKNGKFYKMIYKGETK